MNHPLHVQPRTLLALLVGVLALGLAAPVIAQNDDGAADPLAGVTIETLSSGVSGQLDGRALLLMRMTLEPGVSISPHRHPGPVALTVLSGSFGTEIVDGVGLLTRHAGNGTPAAPERTDLRQPYTLEPGDTLFYEGTAHTMANPGSEPLVLLISAAFDPEQPGFIFLEGTPTP